MKIVVIFWGDPHFQTQDGLQYTFNGLGEFVLVTAATLELQVRLVRAWDSNKQPSRTGTVFGAFVGRAFYEEGNETVSTSRVHVEMTADRTSGTISQLTNKQTNLFCVDICTKSSCVMRRHLQMPIRRYVK